MHRNQMATYTLNDVYHHGLELVNTEMPSVQDKKALQKLIRGIRRANLISKLGLSPYNIIITALFKEEPQGTLLSSLCDSGWQIKKLPLNPFLEKTF